MEFPRFKILFIAFLVEGAALTAAFLFAGYFNIELFPLSDDLYRDLFIGTLGALPPLSLFVFTLSQRAENIPILGSLRKTMITEIKVIFSGLSVFDIILISLLAGFAEELLFRGAVQGRFGIVLASVLFGVVHFVTPSYAVVAVIMGFYIGLFFSLFDSLFIPIQLHFIYDLTAILYLKYFTPLESPSDLPQA